MLKHMIFGAILLNACAIALFFFRFWKLTRDRLFAFFALAFLLLGAERVILASLAESQPLVYLMRLCAFLTILFAVWDKNRGSARVPRQLREAERDAAQRF